MKNKNYLILYLISLGIGITNFIQTGLAIATGMFIELNPLGFNWFIIFLSMSSYLFLLIFFFIKNKSYKRVFMIDIVYLIFIGIGVFVHDFIVINRVY